MTKAIIFDFDGVVVDSEVYWDTETIHEYRKMIPAWSEKDDQRLKGRSVLDIHGMLVKEYGFTWSMEEYMRAIDAFADGIYASRTQLMPGFRELHAMIRKAGLPIGLASSSMRRWIDLAAARLELSGAFDHIVVAKDVGIGKPDPAVYLEAARRLGIAPAHCTAIEDSRNGVAAAKAAGMTCIGLRHADGAIADDLSQADVIVGSLEDIDPELLGLAA